MDLTIQSNNICDIQDNLSLTSSENLFQVMFEFFKALPTYILSLTH